MIRPIRLQLSRAPGFRLQELSRAMNGLEAVVVSRPTRWGNPWKVEPAFESAYVKIPEITPDKAVALYRMRCEKLPDFRQAIAERLRGKNLACWCAPGSPCHGDVLLEIANR